MLLNVDSGTNLSSVFFNFDVSTQKVLQHWVKNSWTTDGWLCSDMGRSGSNLLSEYWFRRNRRNRGIPQSWHLLPEIRNTYLLNANNSYLKMTRGPRHSSSGKSLASHHGGPGTIPGSGQVGFVVDKVALGQVFSEYFSFPYQSSFHKLLHNHPHLSSGAGTISQKWPQCKGLSPTPLAIKKLLKDDAWNGVII
jgi:hypothetical protein